MLQRSIVTSVLLLLSTTAAVQAFLPAPSVEVAFSLHHYSDEYHQRHNHVPHPVPEQKPTTTALNVWWFGGSDADAAVQQQDDSSCELVPVRIERPTSNSRKIFGDIYVEDATVDDCWAILTDYDRLSTHVPNLVESRVVGGGGIGVGEPGDGKYTCRLYQKGAQKIVGFEFRADVTMEMTEKIRRMPAVSNGAIGDASRSSSSKSATTTPTTPVDTPTIRKIGFKCIDSFFFGVFDGEWTVQEVMGENGKPITKLSYSVLVQPKGPVPVAALEWRIREDVPTNLRAVKAAATTVGRAGVMAYRERQRQPQRQLQRRRRTPTPQRTNGATAATTTTAMNNGQQRRPRLVQDFMGREQQQQQASAPRRPSRRTSRANDLRQNSAQPSRLSAVRVKWDTDETMARYLNE
eukprot:CAMPEP_0194036532 /NCGR_PEP_ID=MMETSP0009_2-20130614/8894_1 /TAXON_ID=210454 /ORGANISM="Grammatophora oceanica, Strain CCMP 410" /LENGTH=406 /DNA_ID=CAMNT_0038678335 /DNA_START=56 /DNA_END=1276 /DNA_ORIENTATION=+